MHEIWFILKVELNKPKKKNSYKTGYNEILTWNSTQRIIILDMFYSSKEISRVLVFFYGLMFRNPFISNC